MCETVSQKLSPLISHQTFVYSLSCCLTAPANISASLSRQILIELETALLDDTSHWYKLQTHDVSSIPLPQPSPYLPRRHVHGDSPSKKLQSTCVGAVWRPLNLQSVC